MKRIVAMSLAWALFFLGCTIADEERCAKGYEYLPDDMVCFRIVDAGPEKDAGGGDAGEGFWQVCDNQEDCAGLESDYCVAMPQESGNCTYTNCDSSDDVCPAGYICCNCTAFAYIGEVLCGPESWRESFIATQCQCE